MGLRGFWHLAGFVAFLGSGITWFSCAGLLFGGGGVCLLFRVVCGFVGFGIDLWDFAG